MVFKPQKTKLQLLVIDNYYNLSQWAVNPWRRYSLALTVVLTGYFLGSSLGMISAVVELMDPVGALLSVIYLYTYTIGSIPLFSKYGYFKSIEEINRYIKDKKSTFEIRTCEDETFFQRMIKSFMRLLGLFQDYLLPLILFYILISYTNKIRNKLSNVEGMFGNFKLSFVIMNIVLIVSLGSLLYPAFSEKFSYFIRSENK